MNDRSKPEAFVVQIFSRENATWQGTVTWTEGNKTKPFRSAMELMRLIDSTADDAASE